MNVVHHGSVAFDVSNIVLHSFALLLTLYAVGATLFHVHVLVLEHVLSILSESLALNDTAYVHGSVKVFWYVAVVFHALTIVPAHHAHS